MSYNKNFEHQLNNLKEQILKSEGKDFDKLVYKYQFYQMVNITLENEMIEIDKFKNILETDTRLLEKLYNKYMDLVDVKSQVDYNVLDIFLEEIKDENEKEISKEENYYNSDLKDKITDIFYNYYKDSPSKNKIEDEIIQEMRNNKIPYHVLQYLNEIYDDSLSRCNERYINKIKNILEEANNYYFGNKLNKDTIKYLTFKDVYLKAYKEYKNLKKLIDEFNNEKNQEEKRKIEKEILKNHSSIHKIESIDGVVSLSYECSSMFIEWAGDRLIIGNTIDIYHKNNILKIALSLNNLLNIAENIESYNDLNELLDNKLDIAGKESIELRNMILNEFKEIDKTFNVININEEVEEEEENV